MAYKLSFDPLQNAIFCEYPGEHLQTEAEVDVFFQRLYDKLDSIGRKIYFVADMQDFTIDPSLAAYYANGLRKLLEKYVISIYRYNVKGGMPGLAIRLASLHSGQPANIFPSREAVLEALAEARQKQLKI
jgi:hypothetical protein